MVFWKEGSLERMGKCPLEQCVTSWVGKGCFRDPWLKPKVFPPKGNKTGCVCVCVCFACVSFHNPGLTRGFANRGRAIEASVSWKGLSLSLSLSLRPRPWLKATFSWKQINGLAVKLGLCLVWVSGTRPGWEPPLGEAAIWVERGFLVPDGDLDLHFSGGSFLVSIESNLEKGNHPLQVGADPPSKSSFFHERVQKNTN